MKKIAPQGCMSYIHPMHYMGTFDLEHAKVIWGVIWYTFPINGSKFGNGSWNVVPIMCTTGVCK